MTGDPITGKLAAMLKDAAPAESVLSGTGRGPTGRLRNFRAMNDAKLRATLEAVELENDDPEALSALRDELRGRATR